MPGVGPLSSLLKPKVKPKVRCLLAQLSPQFPAACKQPNSRQRHIQKPAASNVAVFDSDQTSPESEVVSKPRKLQSRHHSTKPHQHQANQHLPQRPPDLLNRSAASQQAYKQHKQAVNATHATSTAAQQARNVHIRHQHGSDFSTSVSGEARWQKQHQKGPALNRNAILKAGGPQHQKSIPVNKTALQKTTNSKHQQHPKGMIPSTDTASTATEQHERHQDRQSDAASEAAANMAEGGVMPHPGIINRFIVDAASANEVLRVYADLKEGFNVINLATAFHRLAKHYKLLSPKQQQQVRAQPASKAMAAAVMGRLDECNSRALANLAWAQALMKLGPPEFMPQVLRRLSCALEERRDPIQDMELSIICWAAAKQECLPRAMWNQMSPLLCARLPGFKAQMLSNVIWACATMGFADDAVFIKAAAQAAIQMRKHLQEQNLANVAWAFAKLGYFDKALFEALSSQAITVAHQMTDLDLAHVTWAMCHAFSAQAASEGIDVKDQVQTITYSNSFIAQDTRSALLIALRNQLTSFLTKRSNRISHVALATCMSSFAGVGYYSPELHDRAADQITRNIMYVNIQSVANIMFACTTQRHYHPSLFAAFAQQGVKLLADPATATQFSPLAISSIVISYAIHTAAEDKQTCAAFIAALAERAFDTLEEFDTRGVANTAWGLAVWGHLSGPFFLKVRSLSPAMVHAFQPQELQQLYQVELILRLEAPDLGLDTSHIDRYEALFVALQARGQLIGAAQARWQHNMGPAGLKSSAFQRDVAAALGSLPLNYDVELEYTQAEYTVDMALPRIKLAVEADGPLHFMRNVPKAIGRTLVKRRSLQKMGWTVLSVPYFHWQALLPEMRQVYMWKRLQQLDSTPLSASPALTLDAANMANEPCFSDAELQKVDRLVAESIDLGLLVQSSQEWQQTFAEAQAQLTDQSHSRRLNAAQVQRLKQFVASRQQQQMLQPKAGKNKLSRHDMLLKIAQSRRMGTS
ncbi:hypothetical protein WJX77_003060 [Trebouxia sp. C0004]